MANVPIPVAPTRANGPQARILIDETSASTFNALRGTAGTDFSEIPTREISEEKEWAEIDAMGLTNDRLARFAEHLRNTGQART